MFVPEIIGITTHTKCNLNCEFCIRSSEDFTIPNESMNMLDFQNYVNMCRQYGIKNFELTPIIGEAFLDPEFLPKLQWMSTLPDIGYIVLFTNCTQITEEIARAIAPMEKLRLVLSIYGRDPDSFKRRTGRDQFTSFTKSLAALINHCGVDQRKCHISYNDMSRYDNDPRKSLTIDRIIEILHIDGYKTESDINWHEMANCPSIDKQVHRPEKGGICEYALHDIGIWPNGEVGICSNWFDANREMVVGCLRENTLSEILAKGSTFDKIISLQNLNIYSGICATCSYTPGEIVSFKDTDSRIQEMVEQYREEEKL